MRNQSYTYVFEGGFLTGRLMKTGDPLRNPFIFAGQDINSTVRYAVTDDTRNTDWGVAHVLRFEGINQTEGLPS